MTTDHDESINSHAQALLEATSEVAGEHIGEARKRLKAALESSKRFIGTVKEKAVEGAKATDAAVHSHPYQAMGVALAIGAVLGYLLGTRRGCSRD